ncbi:hypothetical protein LCGC14_1650650 [marine sediment metagenome]|uniref:Uncharacterized protein n=1 Tax=marine sediment metagenome TaxID=412755 RepID=A0A0F9KCP7_9ZZZZ
MKVSSFLKISIGSISFSGNLGLSLVSMINIIKKKGA